MNKLKNDKGVTLIVLTITIIVLLIVTSITISNSRSQLAIKKVNNLYTDIESISTKVSDYYLKNNSLPVFEDNVYLNNSSELGLLINANGGDKSIINPNDDGEYYVLKLSELSNLTLNYGKDFKEWNASCTFQDYQDLYIINSVSHQIYYPKGIRYNGNVYFTKGTSEIVEKITASGVSGSFEISKIDATKTTVDGSDKVVINSDVILNIGEGYNKETLQYAWKVSDDTNETTYSSFELNDEKNAKLMSGQLDDSLKYTLYIKLLDTNGTEHVTSKEIDFSSADSQEG